VAQVGVDRDFSTSGVHWSWGNRQVPGRQAFAQPLSAKATQLQLAFGFGNSATNLSALLINPMRWPDLKNGVLASVGGRLAARPQVVSFE
jgi:hypothetical protein